MGAIIIPLCIITLLVGFYYAGDVWKSVQSSIPFIGDKESELPKSKEKIIPPPSSNSPFDNLR